MHPSSGETIRSFTPADRISTDKPTIRPTTATTHQYRKTTRQSAGVLDIDGMIGANSVAVSHDGKFAYVSSGGYYRGAF